MPRAGQYRHRITIRLAPADTTRDTFGRRKGSGATVCTVWAEKQDWQSSETTQSGREVTKLSTKWKIRYRTDVNTEMEIVHGEEVYRLTGVMDFDGRQRELVLTSEQAPV